MLAVNLNLLIAEDDISFRKFLLDYFRSRGIKNIYEASSGAEALQVCIENHINFIFSDWNMPEMSGGNFLESVREILDYKDVPFIMLSVLSEKEKISKALKNKVDDYIVKPFRIKHLEKRFESVLLDKCFSDYVALAFTYVGNQNYRLAKEKLTVAIQKNNQDEATLSGLIICHAELGELEKAAKYVKLLKHKNAAALSLYAEGVLDSANNSLNAISKFRKCIEIDNSFVKASIKLAQIQIVAREFEVALKLVESIDIQQLSYLCDVEAILKIYRLLNDRSGGLKTKVLEYSKRVNYLKTR